MKNRFLGLVTLISLTALASCGGRTETTSSQVNPNPSSKTTGNNPAPSSQKENNNKPSTPTVKNLSRKGTMRLDYNLLTNIHSLQAPVTLDSSSDGSNFVFSFSPVVNKDGSLDKNTTQENYQSLSLLTNLDGLLSLASMAGMDPIEMPTLYTMEGNHFINYDEKTQTYDDDNIAISYIQKQAAFFNYANLGQDNQNVHGLLEEDLSDEDNEIASLIETIPAMISSLDLSSFQFDPVDTVTEIFTLLGMTSFKLDDYRYLTKTIGQAMDILGTGLEADVEKKDGHVLYQASLNDDGLAMANAYLAQNDSIPSGMQLSFTSNKGYQEGTILPLNLSLDFAKDSFNNTYLSSLSFDLSLTLSMDAMGMKMDIPVALSLNLTFEGNQSEKEANYFTSYQSQLDKIAPDFEKSKGFYAKGIAYTKSESTDITTQGESDFNNYLASYDAFSSEVKRYLTDHVSVSKKTDGSLDDIKVKTTGLSGKKFTSIKNAVKSGRDALSSFLSDFEKRASKTFTDDDFKSNSKFLKLSAYQNYEKAIQESDKGSEVITAWTNYINTYMQEKTTWYSTYESHLDAFHQNKSKENLSLLADDYQTQLKSTLLSDNLIPSALLPTYQTLEALYLTVSTDVLDAYSQYLVSYIQRDDLDLNALYQEISGKDTSYAKVVSEKKMPLFGFGQATYPASEARKAILRSKITSVASTLSQKLQAEADSKYTEYLASIKTIAAKEDGAEKASEKKTLENSMSAEITKLDTLEADLLGSSKTFSQKLSSLSDFAKQIL